MKIKDFSDAAVAFHNMIGRNRDMFIEFAHEEPGILDYEEYDLVQLRDEFLEELIRLGDDELKGEAKDMQERITHNIEAMKAEYGRYRHRTESKKTTSESSNRIDILLSRLKNADTV